MRIQRLGVSAIVVAGVLAIVSLHCGSRRDCPIPRGCPSDRPGECPASGAPSYSLEVAPLLRAYCANCHAAGTPTGDKWPVSDVAWLKANAQNVLDSIVTCNMPPAGGTPFDECQRKAVLTWLVCGAPDN